MKHFGTVGERYCIAQQRNVPVEIWWDNDGNRLERCLNQDRCSYEKAMPAAVACGRIHSNRHIQKSPLRGNTARGI
ncbi:MAG: hypothetical protein ACI4I8_02785 [Oscillospiraceae bacterium]